MELGKVYVDAVTVPNGKRPLDDRKVAGLAGSLSALGLQQPISVWAPNDDTVVLVAGRHRFAAAKQLGWDEIDCIFVQMDEIDRELWEIDENLARAELSTEEKREHLRRRKELWEERKRENQVGRAVPPEVGYKNPPPQTKGFAAETAATTGLSKRQINRLLAEPKPAAPRTPPSNFPQDDYERSTNWRRSFERLWNSAPTLADKDWAREWIDQPIMDRSAAE